MEIFFFKEFATNTGESSKDREDVGAHQGTDTLAVCEGDKYPTIGVDLTEISMCISSMCPTTACSVVKDSSTVTATNSSLTQTVSRVSGGMSMISRAQ